MELLFLQLRILVQPQQRIIIIHPVSTKAQSEQRAHHMVSVCDWVSASLQSGALYTWPSGSIWGGESSTCTALDTRQAGQLCARLCLVNRD